MTELQTMITPTMIWMALPFLLGLMIYLLPRLDRVLGMTVAIASCAYGLKLILDQSPRTVELLDSFGVTLGLDPLSGFFILTNGIVTAAVLLYCWPGGKSAFFYKQLIAYPRTNRSIWVALRYLFVSNTVMLFYLVGTALVYQANNSFSFAGLENAPPEATALIFLGLLTKGGIFASGLWLPLTHSESETPVSAMLSGVVVKAGVFPLARLALTVDSIDPIVRIFGVGTALLGVGYAVFEKDAKRMLAFHTISQLGFILAAPEVGGFYALTHGLVKSSLFLISGSLPTRNLKELKHTPIQLPLWIALVIASFSISGFPLLSGFGAKVLTMKNLLPWQVIGMNLAALGTAISFAKFIFVPFGQTISKPIKPGFWPAVGLLLAGLFAANVVYYEAYSLANIVKPLATIALGWLAYLLIFQRAAVKLPRLAEQFEHLIGGMTLMLMMLFWMVLA